MTRSARKEGYSRRHRFAQRGSFGPVLRTSRKVRGRFAVLHVVPGRDSHSRLGIALTKRLVASSTDRNRVKRLVREAFRRHVVKSSGLDCVLTLRQRFVPGDLEAIAAEVGSLFDQLNPDGAR